MSAELFRKKLLAWLAEPWDQVFWPPDQREQGRSLWRKQVLQLFSLSEDAGLLQEIDRMIRHLEGFADLRTPAVDFCSQPKFIHPLSGEEISVPEWGSLAGRHENIRQTALEVLSMIASVVREPEERVLALWRLAPELLKRQERLATDRVRLGASWDLAPAYDFAPYITIWQRNAVAAALASALPSPAFLSFRLGGVQEFIDRARTTEDYWAGSYLVSYLTWKAAEVVAAKLGPDAILFPALYAHPLVDLWLRGRANFKAGPLEVPEPPKEELTEGSFPNGLLAIVPCRDENAVRELGDEVLGRFRKEWEGVCAAVKQGLEGQISLSDQNYWDRLWTRQVPADRVFELFWTVTPWPDTASYREIFSMASREMEARKTLRDFRGEPEPNIKCHQCGLREALQDSQDFGSKQLWRTLAGLEDDLEHRFRERERLCAVCTTRRLAVRLYFRRHHRELGLRLGFPSTSAVAVTPYLRKILESAPKLAQPASQFHDALEKMGVPSILESPFERLEREFGAQLDNSVWWLFLHIDGDWWFEESYDSKQLQEEFGDRFKSKHNSIQAALDQLQQFRRALKEQRIEGPPNYFAVLAADGDLVGDWIRGDHLPNWSQSLHPAVRGSGPRGRRPASLLTHLALSQCVGNLPRAMRPVIQQELDGALVYTGGDDLLALVPVARLAAGMQAYAKTFSQSHQVRDASYFLLPGSQFTVSVAAFVLHHTDPLQGAIREAHHLLRGLAKDKKGYDRQAGVIAVRRQSGQQTEMGAKWYLAGVTEPPFAILQELAGGLAAKDLSPRFITQVAGLRDALTAVISQQALSRMLEAILERARREAKPNGKAILDKLHFLLQSYLHLAMRDPANADFHPWKQLERALLVGRFLARMA